MLNEDREHRADFVAKGLERVKRFLLGRDGAG